MEAKKIMSTLLYWFLIAFMAYIIIQIITTIRGGSLGFDELIIGLLIANLGYSFYIGSKIQKHLGWHEGVRNGRKKTAHYL